VVTIRVHRGVLLAAAVAVAGAVAAVLILLTAGSGGGEEKPRASSRTISVPTKGNVLGYPDAPVTVIEYSDFQCPFCRRFFMETERLLMADYIETGKVKLEYRHFAFLGPESLAAAEAAECAGEQGQFWPYHDILFQRQGQENSGAFSRENLISFAEELGLDVEAFTSCMDSAKYRQKVLSQTEEGRALGVSGTPTFIIGKYLVRGAQPYEVFRQAIDQALAEAQAAQ